MDEKTSKRGIVYLIICALLWSTGGVLIKVVPWHPMVIAGLRGLIAAMVIWAALCREGYPKPVFNKNTLRTALFLSFTMMLFVIANKLTTAANTIVLQSANPVVVLFFCYFIYHQKCTKVDLAAVVLILSGITLFFFDQLSPGSLLGNLLALGSAVALGGTYVSATKAENLGETLSGVFCGHCLNAIFSIPFLFLAPPTIEPVPVIALLFLGVFQLGLPYVLFSHAARICSPLAISMIGMLEPICNPVLVALFVHEIPGKMALIGGAIVLLTLFAWGIYNNRNKPVAQAVE